MDLWKDKRLRLAITRLGGQYLVAMLLMGGFAVNTGNNLLYMIFSLMLGLFLASGWISRRAIRDLELVAVEEGNIFARVRGGIRVRLRERAPGRFRGLELHLDLEHGTVEPGFYAGGPRANPDVLVVLHAQPALRGPARLGRLELRTAFPFGLVEKAWSFQLDRTVLVLPHPRSLVPRVDWEGELRQSLPRAGASSPDGARPFREQDPLSRVHWKRTAQRGAPWVRTFEDDQPIGLRLFLDLRAWAPGPEFERELEVLSGGILQARLHRRQILLVLAGAGGRQEYQGFTSCWRALALAAAEGGGARAQDAPVQASGSALP
jgi:uncharacterized protein (DUF58 family)